MKNKRDSCKCAPSIHYSIVARVNQKSNSVNERIPSPVISVTDELPPSWHEEKRLRSKFALVLLFLPISLEHWQLRL